MSTGSLGRKLAGTDGLALVAYQLGGKGCGPVSDTRFQPQACTWRVRGRRRKENVGESNCLWHCLAAFSFSPKKKRFNRQLRQFTVHSMRERSDELRPIWEACGNWQVQC